MIKVFFPRGGGGNWLSNLIWHLEKADFSLPSVKLVFDGQPRCSIPFSHRFEIPDPSRPEEIHDMTMKFLPYGAELSRPVVFSCAQLYTHYLNNAVKTKYRVEGLEQMHLRQHLFELSNGVKYYLTNEYYSKCYCRNIDLDYALIFQDPEQFTDVLLEFLDSTNIKYTANKDYMLSSMANYTTTCPNPSAHVNNWDSMLWLGFCHAITILDQLPIAVIPPDADQMTVVEILRPHAEHYMQRVRPLVLEWAQR